MCENVLIELSAYFGSLFVWQMALLEAFVLDCNLLGRMFIFAKRRLFRKVWGGHGSQTGSVTCGNLLIRLTFRSCLVRAVTTYVFSY